MDDFLAMVLTWPDAIYPIFCMYNVEEILTLIGFSNYSNLAIPFL